MEHKYTSSIECKFSLETDVDTFARRIAYLTGSIHLHHFDTDDGFISLQTTDIAYSDQPDRPHVVYIAGRYYTLKEGAQVANDPSNPISMIRFALSPLPTERQRLEVIATCSEPAVESCLKYLLKDIWENSEEARDGIERCWPEVHEDRKATIAKLAAEIKTTLGELRKEMGKSTAGDGTSRRQATHVSTKHDTAAPTPAEAIESVTMEQAERLLLDKAAMLEYMSKGRGYDPHTAIAIANAIPKARMDYLTGQWGPGCIAEACGFSITGATVGHYLKAFIKRGIRKIDGISVPHRSRKKHRQ